MTDVPVTLFIAHDLVESITIRGEMRFCGPKLENKREQRRIKGLISSVSSQSQLY